jgi:hypothetical protein
VPPPAGDCISGRFGSAGRPGDAGQGDGPGKFRLRQPAGSTPGELRRRNAEVLAAAGQLKPVTIEACPPDPAEIGLQALHRRWPGTGSGA